MKDTLKDMSEKEREELSSRIVAEFKVRIRYACKQTQSDQCSLT